MTEIAQVRRAVQKFDVGGVLLDRPFAIRRLGHFGFNFVEMASGIVFYRDLLGLMVSDRIDYRDTLEHPERLDGMGDTAEYFLRYSTDHHSFVMFPARVRALLGRQTVDTQLTVNQITWQVGSLREVDGAATWLKDDDRMIVRRGRDQPGSNWHVYTRDPGGTTNELYYGMEQIGWNGRSKPSTLYDFGYREEPPLPQRAEADEIDVAKNRGEQLDSGYRHSERAPREFDVDGVMLARPFKIVGIGPVRLFTEDMEASRDFYERVLGLTLTAEVSYSGHRVLFFRANTEHHSIALYPMELRSELDLSDHSVLMSFGFRLASYRQLREAITYLRDRDVVIRDLPAELTPGIDYAAYAVDPDGHAIELYCSMAQVGSIGPAATTPKMHALRPARFEDWPEFVDGLDDAYRGQVFLGPLG